MCSAWAVAPRCWSTTDEPAKAARSLKDPQETRDRRAAAADRRRRRELRLRERRSGFERRSVDSSGLRLAYDRALVVYRADSVRFWTVLATIVVFNFLDLMLTIRSLDRGAIELNPVMRTLFWTHPVIAAVVKLGIVGAVALMLQRMRRYRRALEVSLVLLVGFTVLMFYHAAFAVGWVG